MKTIKISDVTMKQTFRDFRLTFKEKIELAKLLSRLGADYVELEAIKDTRIDALQIKSIASAITDSGIAVPVELNKDSVEKTFKALQYAKKPRLQVAAPTSAVQIEYLYHKKPDILLEDIASTIAACKELCCDVEFIAEDATRSERNYLYSVIETAINAGATTVTIADTAGIMLPNEFSYFISSLYNAVPALNNVIVGVKCTNTIAMADACSISAINLGIEQISASAYPVDAASLTNIARIIYEKEEALAAKCNIGITQLTRISEQIKWLFHPTKNKLTTSAEESAENVYLTIDDSISEVIKAITTLGYDLSDEDNTRVYNSFKEIAARKSKVGLKELDAIVASSAMQMPQTYKLDTYVITSGNNISATAHIKLLKNGLATEGVYMGDGAIDAAFEAIEKITGCHYELDDFQLQAVTEGREAMGQTIVKLRSGGKLYSGRGISTDIVGAGIQAYLSALNKIIYEEQGE